MTAKIKSHAKKSSLNSHHKPKNVSTREFEKVHWPYLPILVIIFFLLSFGIQTGALQAAMQNRGSVLAYATSMSRSGLLSSTNSARSANGVNSLGLNSKLNAAAQAKANDMASRNYWSHNTPEGNPPWVFVSAQGYAYKKLGENLATGFNNEQATVNGWMASPSHKANMLDSAFTQVGFGYANNSNYTAAGGGPMTIIVAFYGKPASSSSPSPAPLSSPPTSPQPTAQSTKPKSSPPPASKPPKKTPVKKEIPVEQDAPKEEAPQKPEPVTTENENTGISLGLRSSRADVAFAKLPIYNFATGIAIFGVVAALGFWIGRHAFAVRRVLVNGEKFIYRHPLMDIGLIIIAALFYLLTQTAGFIQ